MKGSKARLCLCLAVLSLPACQQSSHELQPEEIWTRVSPSVVRVEAKLLEGGTRIGSGFVCELGGKKVILSNRHVVLGAKEVRVGPSAGNLFRSPAYRISPELDLALIDQPGSLRIAPLKTRANGVRIGERIFAVGFPLGLNKSITQGLVSSETEKLVQFDAPISSGNSGGPLVDSDGAAVGVVTAGSTGSGDEIAQNLNFAIKAAFIPKAELFKEPIVRFYDAWHELVAVENRLIDELHDRRVFEIQRCVDFEFGIELLVKADADSAAFYRTNRAQLEQRLKSLYAEDLDSAIQRYGSLDAGVTNVASFLRNQLAEFDKIPQMFADLGSDDLLKSFGHDQRRKTAFVWDIKPSQITPLLSASVEFAKAKYEDTAYKIEFTYRGLQRIRRGDTNFLTLFTNAYNKDVGDRMTVRLAYNELGTGASDENRIHFFRLCDQVYGHRSSRQWTKRDPLLTRVPLTEQMSEYGGFEEWIASMLFGKIAAERLERGDVRGAIAAEMNEVEMRRYPDLGFLGFAYACNGEFERAYDTAAKAYFASFEEVNPFNLDHGGSLAGRMFLLSGLTNDGTDSPYPEAIKVNLKAWTTFVASKKAFSLAQPIQAPRSEPQTGSVFEMPFEAVLTEKLSSPAFQDLSDFEKCWVLHAQRCSTTLSADLFSKLNAIAAANPATSNLYYKYFELRAVK